MFWLVPNRLNFDKVVIRSTDLKVNSFSFVVEFESEAMPSTIAVEFKRQEIAQGIDVQSFLPIEPGKTSPIFSK